MKRSKTAERFVQLKRSRLVDRKSTENHREVIEIQSDDEAHEAPKLNQPFMQKKREVTAFRHEVVDLCSSSDEKSESDIEQNCTEFSLQHHNIANEFDQTIIKDGFPLPLTTTPTPTCNLTQSLDDDFPDDSDVEAILSGAMYSRNVGEDGNEGRKNQGLSDGCSGDGTNECEKDSSEFAKLASWVLTAEPTMHTTDARSAAPASAVDNPEPTSPRQQRDAAADVFFRTHGASALPLLVQSLRTGTPPEKENAASMLRCLVKQKHMKERALAAGAVGPLVRMLNRGTSAGQVHAASALKSLARDPAASAAMVGKGAIPALVQLLLRKDKSPAAATVKAVETLQNLSIYPAHQAQCAYSSAPWEVLWNLQQTAVHREAIVGEGGVLALRLCAQYSACAATRKRADLLVKSLTQHSS